MNYQLQIMSFTSKTVSRSFELGTLGLPIYVGSLHCICLVIKFMMSYDDGKHLII